MVSRKQGKETREISIKKGKSHLEGGKEDVFLALHQGGNRERVVHHHVHFLFLAKIKGEKIAGSGRTLTSHTYVRRKEEKREKRVLGEREKKKETALRPNFF